MCLAGMLRNSSFNKSALKEEVSEEWTLYGFKVIVK